MSNTQRILKIKQDIDQSKTDLAKLEGVQESQLTQLKEDWNCDSLKKAEKQVEKWEKAISTLSEEITKELKELEDTYYMED